MNYLGDPYGCIIDVDASDFETGVVVGTGINLTVLFAEMVVMGAEHYVLILQGAALYESHHIAVGSPVFSERHHKIPPEEGLKATFLVARRNVLAGEDCSAGSRPASLERVGSKVAYVLGQPIFSRLSVYGPAARQEHQEQQAQE